MSINSYSSLTSAINDWSARTYPAGVLQQFVSLAESEFNLVLRSHRKELSGTMMTNSNGEASIPAGFREIVSIVRDYPGALPLIPVGWAKLQSLNSRGEAGVPVWYAIQGTTLKVAPIYEGDFTITYVAALMPLTDTNQTNWLILLAPQAYLFMSLAMASAYNKNFDEAAVWKSQALEKLAEIGIQSDLAQYADAGLEVSVP